MTEKKFLTMSENGKSEYCCSVVRINELTPIEGSDFLAKTNVLGTQIVVRKDMVKEGDIMFYAANETALNEKFLSANNLYEISCRDMNANAAEVNAIMSEYQVKYKDQADKLRSEAKQIKSQIDSYETTIKKSKKKINKLNKDLEKSEDPQSISIQIQELNDKIDKATKLSLEKTVVYTDLKKRIESLVNEGKPIVDKAKVLCGFFNKYGRVRCITLKGTPSFGFLFEINSMAKYNPGIKDVNLEDYLNQDFDTVDGELFVKAYVPPVKPENVRKSKGEKRNKKLNRFDRLVEGELRFHYDTGQIQKNMHVLSPDAKLLISNKLHGTSSIIGKIHVKNPLPMIWYKRYWNKMMDFIDCDKIKFKTDYTVDYGPVYCSRTVVKNQYINQDVNGGYYNVDIWSEYGDIVYPYLDCGMTIYGEICGYLTGSESFIQKMYDYGCKKGENFLMIYRVSVMNENGERQEWNVQDVHDWTVQLIDRMKDAGDDNWKRIHPIDILYHGTLGDLYPDLDEDNHWHENVLEKMKNDKEHFGMEDYEPMCNNKVPREGIVIRIDDDPINEAFKLKTVAFALGEAVLYDDDDYQDIEVQEGDY